MKLTEMEKAYYNGYKQGRFDEYAESEQEKSMELTYKQQTCPVCHGDVALDENYLDHDNFQRLWIDKNKLYDEMIYKGNVIKGNGWDQPITINYCPMCGRPLNEEEE